MGELLSVSVFVLSLVMHLTNCSISNKRLVLHSDVDMAAAIQTLTARIEKMGTDIAQLTSQNNQLMSEIQSMKSGAVQMTNELAQMKQQNIQLENQLSDGSVYIRWGRTTCNQNGTELVYSGYTGGNEWSLNGAADYICLAGDPVWAFYNDSAQPYGPRMSGTEYEFNWQHRDGGSQFFGSNMQDHDAPCAVCRSIRPTSLMIPGRSQCYPGWTLEYWGYLVSGLSENKSPTNYACLDARPELEVGGAKHQNGTEMYIVETNCGSLKCPPYVQNREITCVVCSK